MIVYYGNIGIMKKKMETTIVCWGNVGICCESRAKSARS